MRIKITEEQFKKLKDACRIGFDGVNGYAHIDENQKLEVDADEVDLTSFEPKDHLSKDIWKDGVLDSRIRLKLMDIADDFIETLGLNWVEPIDVVLTGSICNFNWSSYSDIDVHVIYDFNEIDENKELIRSYVDSKKREWNETHEQLTIKGFEVEMYVEDLHEHAVSDGVYSLYKNEWINKSSKDNIELKSDTNIKELASELMTMIDDICDLSNEVDDNDVLLSEIQEEIDDLLNVIHGFRKKSLEDDGEMSVGNIVYKVLRRTNYLDKLYALQNEIYDTLNSIE